VDNQTSDVVIGKGEMEKVFIISKHSQQELLKKLGWQSSYGVFGGAALALASLAFVLYFLMIR
jgi:hypothetical protein